MSQRDIPPGADYAIEIPKALNNCDYFLLLMTNDAQNSPYVMLELDQAFRLKKEIIPICLENVVQNEKTNFFLNAKQCVDATADLTTALNDVIRRIGVKVLPPQIQSNHLQVMNEVARKEKVCCPHCGCTTLKRNNSFVTRYLNLEKNYTLEEAVVTGLLKNRRKLNAYIFLGSLVSMLITILVYGVCCSDEISSLDSFFMILPVLFLATLAYTHYFVISGPDLPKILINAIKNTKLRYWSFKCAQCEKTFGFLIPKDDELKDWVESLLKNKDEN